MSRTTSASLGLGLAALVFSTGCLAGVMKSVRSTVAYVRNVEEQVVKYKTKYDAKNAVPHVGIVARQRGHSVSVGSTASMEVDGTEITFDGDGPTMEVVIGVSRDLPAQTKADKVAAAKVLVEALWPEANDLARAAVKKKLYADGKHVVKKSVLPTRQMVGADTFEQIAHAARGEGYQTSFGADDVSFEYEPGLEVEFDVEASGELHLNVKVDSTTLTNPVRAKVYKKPTAIGKRIFAVAAKRTRAARAALAKEERARQAEERERRREDQVERERNRAVDEALGLVGDALHASEDEDRDCREEVGRGLEEVQDMLRDGPSDRDVSDALEELRSLSRDARDEYDCSRGVARTIRDARESLEDAV